MQRFAHGTWTGFALCALWGCSAPPPPAPAAVPPATADAQLGRIVERYWDDRSRVQSVAPQAIADSLALEKRYLAEVAAIAPGALSTESQLTREVFRRERVLGIEGYTYPSELLPIDPFDGLPQRYAVEAPAALRLAASSPKEFAEWRDRAAAFTQWTQQAILNMREGMRRGYTLPRISVQKILPQLALLGTDSPENRFYRALGSGPSNAALEDAVKRQILPAYRDLHTFLSREYLPRARQSIALSALPLGEAWYGHLANVATGGARTPAQLHALGLAELERLRARVPAVLAQASFSGNAQSFIEYMRTDPRFSYKNAAALTGAYQDLKGQLAAALPALFSASPRAGFAIRDVEPFRQPVAESLSYRPRSPDGLLAAVLYVNTDNLGTRPAIDISAEFLREAMPGRHFQLELLRERTDLPRFRRYGGSPVFIEGWALYAATLGEELGVYRDAEAKFGSLLEQMKCAAGLVIDTGVHAGGWSRAQAVDYLQVQAPTGSQASAENRVDRIIARPAEALSCTVGFLEIEALRTLARQKLGERFDQHHFHAQMISQGALPLDLLQAQMKLWMNVAGAQSVADRAAPPDVRRP